jgi:hypothetical protein
MANGKPGDSEFTDVVYYGREVFGEKLDRLIRELHELGGFDPRWGPQFINTWAFAIRMIESPPSDPEQAVRAMRHNLASHLGFQVAELRGEIQPNVPWSLPPEDDPWEE